MATVQSRFLTSRDVSTTLPSLRAGLRERFCWSIGRAAQKRRAGNRHAREPGAGHHDMLLGDGLRGRSVSPGGLARRHQEAELERRPACCRSHFHASSRAVAGPICSMRPVGHLRRRSRSRRAKSVVKAQCAAFPSTLKRYLKTVPVTTSRPSRASNMFAAMVSGQRSARRHGTGSLAASRDSA